MSSLSRATQKASKVITSLAKKRRGGTDKADTERPVEEDGPKVARPTDSGYSTCRFGNVVNQLPSSTPKIATDPDSGDSAQVYVPVNRPSLFVTSSMETLSGYKHAVSIYDEEWASSSDNLSNSGDSDVGDEDMTSKTEWQTRLAAELDAAIMLHGRKVTLDDMVGSSVQVPRTVSARELGAFSGGGSTCEYPELRRKRTFGSFTLQRVAEAIDEQRSLQETE